MEKGWAYGPIPSPRIKAYPRTINKGRNENCFTGRGNEYFMEDLTLSEDKDHLGTFVRGDREPSQSLNTAY